jgi:two-component system, OmpR family, sensor kinase
MTEPRPKRWTPSARMRILGWYLVLLATALTAALVIQRSYMLEQVVNDAELILDREVEEIRQLSGGINPATGEPFAGDVQAIFDIFIERNVPLAGEGVLTIVDGVPYKSDITGSYFRGTDLLQSWAQLTEPERGRIETDEGPVHYVAVPLEDGQSVGGVFVVTVFLQGELDKVDRAIRVGALVLGSVFVLASATAWLAAGDVLKPLRTTTETARTITESDLSRRIEVEGSDEIADLGHTFNAMLDRLEEAFDTQRRFVDDAGHELRTPITVIRGQLELIGEDPLERASTIALVTDELDRMSRIVEDLLALARAEQPDFVELHPLDLAEFLEEMAAKASGVSPTRVTVSESDPAVFPGDRQRLTQAVMNLIRNSFEHNPPGVTVTLAGTNSGRSVRISVTDDGPGIPPEAQSNLFERFYRGQPGKRRTEGAGLGLSIVRAIAEGHGGRVELDTGETGTTFTLVLPGIASQAEDLA